MRMPIPVRERCRRPWIRLRRQARSSVLACLLLAPAFVAPAVLAQALVADAQDQANAPHVLDRVVAVVNYQPILWSDIIGEMHFAVLDPNEVSGTLTPQRALEQLISRKLIQQQIREEDATAALPKEDEVRSRMNELRHELPACVRMDCASDPGWQAFLTANRLTAPEVESYLRLRMEMLRFIEIRFRQGIRISREETEAYYRDKLLPQYPDRSRAPSLDAVAPRIEEILLEQHVNVLFGNWLDNLRKQGDVEVMDPQLEESSRSSPDGSVSE